MHEVRTSLLQGGMRTGNQGIANKRASARACVHVCVQEGGREGYEGRRQECTGFECLLKRTHVLVHLVTSRLSRRHADLAPSIWGTRSAEAQLGHVACVLVVSAEHARAQMHVQASEPNAQHNQNPPPQQHTTTTRGMRKKKMQKATRARVRDTTTRGKRKGRR